MSTCEYMLGNVAIARGIVEGGAQVISGHSNLAGLKYNYRENAHFIRINS